MGLKELYVARSMEELNAKLDSHSHQTMSKLNLERLLKAVPKLLEQAEHMEKSGDQEQAYVLYMRALNVFQAIQTRAEYRKHSAYYNEMHGFNNLGIAMAKSEAISDSLERRYKEKRSKAIAKTPNNSQNGGDNRQNELNKKVSFNNGVEYNKESYRDTSGSKNNKIVVKESKLDPVLPKKNDAIALMSAHRLKTLLEMRSTSMLLLDVRPSDEFRASHVKHPQIINIDENILSKTSTAKGIETNLSIELRDLFARRHSFDVVLLVDLYSNDIDQNAKLGVLRDALIKWDEKGGDIKDKLHLLQDGFYGFVNKFPMMVSNPINAKNMKPPKKPTDQEKVPDLADVSYPIFLDNGHIDHSPEKMKDRNGDSSATSGSPSKSNVNNNQVLWSDTNGKNSSALASGAIEVKRVVPMVPDRSSKPLKPLNNNNVINGGHMASTEIAPVVDRGSKVNVLQSDTAKVKTNDARWEALRRQKELEEEAEKVADAQRKEDLMTAKMNKLNLESSEQENLRLREELDELRAKRDLERKLIKDEKDKEKHYPNDENIPPPVLRHEKLKDEPSSPSMSSGQLNRSHSSPNIAQMLEEEDARLGIIPAPKFDRSCKPSGIEARARNFQPVWGTGKKGLTGLKNLGNTCFMNSILQCVANFTLPSQYFIDQIFRRDLNTASETEGRVALEFSEVVKALWSGQFKSISPSDLKQTLGRYKREYAGTQQQDAHEFLLVLMDWLHSDVNEVHVKPTLPELNLDGLDEVKAAKKAAERERSIDCSFIRETFFGQRRSTLQCLSCGHASVTYEAFFEISVPLPEGSNRCSLDSCIESFLKPEMVEWNCPKCKKDRRSKKQLELVRLPLILTVHFSRFFEDSNGIWKKKQNLVDFPMTDVNFSHYVSGCQGRLNQHKYYNLYGVCNHFGTMEGGHYTAYCYSQVYEQWHKYDDQEVGVMSAAKVRTPAAYILFYSAKN